MGGEAPAIQELRTDANARWSQRSKASDGTWGDTAHKARKSDHNTGDAMDVTNDPAHGPSGNVMAAYAIRDKRVKYVIWNRRIYDTRRPGWRPYSHWRTMPHDHHVHISVKQAARADTSDWAFTAGGPAPSIDIPGQTRFEDSDPAKGAKVAAPAKGGRRRRKRRVRRRRSRRQRVADNDTEKTIHIFKGESSVMVGGSQWAAAHVESPHTGGGKIAKGSSSVFVGPSQLAFARKDDPATDNRKVKDGQESILIG